MSTSKAPLSLFSSGTALPSPSPRGAAVVKFVTVLAMLWLAARALLACDVSADNACLRFSDCASGLTCANGECVTPPSGSTDGGTATSGSSSGSTTGTSGNQTTSGTNSGSTTGTGDNEAGQSDDSGTTSTE